jgi:hypothetical protein
MREEDLSGRKFGRVIAIEKVDDIRWRCVCDCGVTKPVRKKDLKSGKTSSCGCLGAERRLAACSSHGMKGSRAYSAWTNMKSRCNNPNMDCYKYYGERGIGICREWNESFDNFYAAMGDPPQGLTLERRDVNGNYEPSNCYWADMKTQNNNKRNNIFVSLNGTRVNLSLACALLGLKYDTVHQRLRDYKWDERRSLGLSQ